MVLELMQFEVWDKHVSQLLNFRVATDKIQVIANMELTFERPLDGQI